MNTIRKYIDYIGVIGPIILMVTSFILLINKNIFLYFYLGGIIVNTLLNLFLKTIIKHPRPKEDKILFEIASNNGKRISIDRYGMPSGHSQSVGFSCMFLYLVCKNMYVLWFYLIISLNTMFQRFNYNSHTLLQIVVGFSIGAIMGYLTFILAKNTLKGKINSKIDDNCFL
jgi:membrane-associated phospholipid phosphatase